MSNISFVRLTLFRSLFDYLRRQVKMIKVVRKAAKYSQATIAQRLHHCTR